LAQYIAIATAEWLDALPFFGEPIANNFLNSSTLGGRFFTLMVFVHIFAPLFILLFMWVHIQRHARARVNPPWPLAAGTGVMLIALSLLHPAVSQAPADLNVVPGELGFDWYYLFAYALLDSIPGGQLWLIIFGGFLLQKVNGPLLGLVVLIAIKIIFDLRVHTREHRQLSATMPPAPDP